MRLLNTETIQLHHFVEHEEPVYAILSHRWEQDEVTFKDLTKRRNPDSAGRKKVTRCCSFVKDLGFKWVWIDTCCIDKSSSAELSESINSMHKWYRGAKVCFAYLSDVACRPDESERTYEEFMEEQDLGQSISVHTTYALRKSAWFTRGWTLQELIAPNSVLFVDTSWHIFGSTNTLGRVVSDITGIADVARQYKMNESVATKMSWASRRRCTRPEDLAYSLMGLFDVNMPLLYGEGGKSAFRRLQLEILRTSGDESIFAWHPTSGSGSGSILASSPSSFSHSSNITLFEPFTPRPPYAMTNKGLEIHTVLLQGCGTEGSMEKNRIYFMPLNCVRGKEVLPLVIRLQRISSSRYTRAPALLDFNEGFDRWPEESELGPEGRSLPGTIFIDDRHRHENFSGDGIYDGFGDRWKQFRSLRGAVDQCPSTNCQP
jgi:hypothetical protein